MIQKRAVHKKLTLFGNLKRKSNCQTLVYMGELCYLFQMTMQAGLVTYNSATSTLLIPIYSWQYTIYTHDLLPKIGPKEALVFSHLEWPSNRKRCPDMQNSLSGTQSVTSAVTWLCMLETISNWGSDLGQTTLWFKQNSCGFTSLKQSESEILTEISNT